MITRLRQLIWHWRNWRQLQALECEVVVLRKRLERVEGALKLDNPTARYTVRIDY